MKETRFYKVAAYLRLSREDGSVGEGGVYGGRTESNSIASQRDMIGSYVAEQDNMEIYDTYVDDGWSGANFVEVR